MSAPARRRKLGRRQKVWLAVILSVVGTAALTVVAVWLASARDTDLGDPNAGLTRAFRGDDVKTPPIRFTDVAASVGIDAQHDPSPRARRLPQDTGSGLAWCDVDGDGDADLVVVTYAGDRLYRNDGGRFVDVSEAAGLSAGPGYGMGVTCADYDGDGDEDLFITNRGPNRLWRNRGDGTFEEVAAAAGITGEAWSTGAAWGDFDRDGHLDLYVANYVNYETEGAAPTVSVGTAAGAYSVPYTLNPNAFDPVPNHLYRNKGDGTFEDVAAAYGVLDEEGRSFAATFCDLDGDGWLDLYVNNDVSANRLFRHPGKPDVPFEDLGPTTGTADPRGSMGLSVAELGAMGAMADELPDLFISHWVAQENALYLSLAGRAGGLEYRDRTRRLRLGEISLDTVGWGSAFVDLDRDGRLDLAVANGSTLESKSDNGQLVAEPIFLFWNAGKRFADAAPGAGPALASLHNARGLAAADYDGDGDVDLAVAINRGRPLLLRNDTELPHHGLTVRLGGHAALRFGARVEVHTSAGRQMRWFGADVSFCSAHAPELIFGLGAAKRASELRVRWMDGTTTTLRDVPAGVVTVNHTP